MSCNATQCTQARPQGTSTPAYLEHSWLQPKDTPMTDTHCTPHFEHVKQPRPFTELEYMRCSKCGLHNPLGLFQHWDTERDGPADKWPPRDNGGKLPAGLTYAVNTS